MMEGGRGELTAPLRRNTYTTEKGMDLVAETLPTLEAFVAVGPDTVHRPDAIGFPEDVFKLDLDKSDNK